MRIAIGIDGTGPKDPDEYEESFGQYSAPGFGGSHVLRLTRQLGRRGFDSRYMRGPTWHGFGSGRIADSARDVASRADALIRTLLPGRRLRQQIQALRPVDDRGAVSSARGGAQTNRNHSTTTVFLAGYSRGGAAVIETAAMLGDRGITVDALFLFDAVDRTVALRRTSAIPSNVRHCYHALRRRAVFSRPFFGNCGKSAAEGVSLVKSRFWGSHGAVGGLPWTAESSNPIGLVHESTGWVPNTMNLVTPRQDQVAAQQVWTWMSSNADQELHASLQSALGTGP